MTDETQSANDAQGGQAKSTAKKGENTTVVGENALTKGLKLVGEAFLAPGTSLLVDGKIKAGIAHTGAGFISHIAFGLPGILVAGANSYSQSVTGKSLLAHLTGPSVSDKNENLATKVQTAVNDGKSLEEIVESTVEDVEDVYHEVTNGKQKTSEFDSAKQ